MALDHCAQAIGPILPGDLDGSHIIDFFREEPVMNSAIDRAKLVSTLAFALRHNPARFGLELDEEGRTSLADMLAAIRFDRFDWALCDRRIRATYGSIS